MSSLIHFYLLQRITVPHERLINLYNIPLKCAWIVDVGFWRSVDGAGMWRYRFNRL